MLPLVIVLGVLAALLVWTLATYNGLIGLRVRADGAWSDIDVQLKRRYDLIPNVIETVKGYAAHEQKVFAQVTEARSRAMQAAGPGEKAQAEGALAGTLKSLFAVAENYPQLRANENFMGLQQSLTQVEETLQGARRYYNAVVRDYNTKLSVLPDRLIAQAGGFTPKEFFQLDSAEEAKTPKVSFS
ncbi:MAG: LemA family protein [Candidatus Omnitrophica bacterium]|nr:LemA family protein [Candidatus Omnitrophota bacterium]